MDRRLVASRKQENRVANTFGGKRTPGSGNQWHTKNDVRTTTHSFELKTTTKSQYTLKAKELEEGEKNAILDGRDFVFGVEMCGREWVVLSMEDFENLVTEVGGLNRPSE